MTLVSKRMLLLAAAAAALAACGKKEEAPAPAATPSTPAAKSPVATSTPAPRASSRVSVVVTHCRVEPIKAAMFSCVKGTVISVPPSTGSPCRSASDF
mgnify:CR=1 FL=1